MVFDFIHTENCNQPIRSQDRPNLDCLYSQPRCQYGRNHDMTCHKNQHATIKPYDESSFFDQGPFSASCPGHLGPVYSQEPVNNLSCKWVTGPGGLAFKRCDNYKSYKDVSVEGTIKHPHNFPQVEFHLGRYFSSAKPMTATTIWNNGGEAHYDDSKDKIRIRGWK